MEKQTQFELGIVALGAVAAMLLALGMIHDSTYIVAYAQQISSSSTPLTQSNNSSSINNVTHTLSVTGTASSKVKPDKVILTLGVQTTNKTANAALATNSVTMNKVLDVLKKMESTIMRQALHPLVSLRTITIHNHLVEQEG